MSEDVPAKLMAKIEELCIGFHDAYEAHAKTEGWETQERSRVDWADVPEANKATMRLTVATVCAPLLDQIEDLETTRSFFASVIKSGESWSEQCEQRMGRYDAEHDSES